MKGIRKEGYLGSRQESWDYDSEIDFKSLYAPFPVHWFEKPPFRAPLDIMMESEAEIGEHAPSNRRYFENKLEEE